MNDEKKPIKPYIGVKQILAAPMTRGDYNTYRSWTMPENENPADEGYLVEYLDSPNSNHPNHDNYISWSPKDVFERSYREVINMTFGIALEALKKGEKVAREGWNGKNMFIYLVEGSIVTDAECLPGPLNKHVFACNMDLDAVNISSHIDMKAADGSVTIGWNPSQIDMLAEDWIIID